MESFQFRNPNAAWSGLSPRFFSEHRSLLCGRAGGWETNNGLTTVGGGKPGGFYNATHIKVNSVQQETSPIPYYLVQMDGNIGQSIQTFYAVVLEDGSIVTPTVVGAATAPQKMKTRSHAKR